MKKVFLSLVVSGALMSGWSSSITLENVMIKYAPSKVNTSIDRCLLKLKNGNKWYYKSDYNEALYYFKKAPEYCVGTPYERASYTHIHDALSKLR